MVEKLDVSITKLKVPSLPPYAHPLRTLPYLPTHTCLTYLRTPAHAPSLHTPPRHTCVRTLLRTQSTHTVCEGSGTDLVLNARAQAFIMAVRHSMFDNPYHNWVSLFPLPYPLAPYCTTPSPVPHLGIARSPSLPSRSVLYP